MEKKDNNKIKQVKDEAVIDSIDVERAQLIAMKRHNQDPRAEHTDAIAPDELLITPPRK